MRLIFLLILIIFLLLIIPTPYYYYGSYEPFENSQDVKYTVKIDPIEVYIDDDLIYKGVSNSEDQIDIMLDPVDPDLFKKITIDKNVIDTTDETGSVTYKKSLRGFITIKYDDTVLTFDRTSVDSTMYSVMYRGSDIAQINKTEGGYQISVLNHPEAIKQANFIFAGLIYLAKQL